MTMTPGVRRLALTVHVASSVGWLGAVSVFLVLAVAGLTTSDLALARAAYRAMQLTGWWVLVPASAASLLSGLVQGLGTPWGVIRHYWVLIKLGITVLACVVLLAHMQPIDEIGAVAATPAFAIGDLRAVRIQLVVNAAAALLVLLLATTLSVYKPRGVTQYGRRAPSRSTP